MTWFKKFGQDNPNPSFEHLLWMMRESGWRVAAHNDYFQDGRSMTFWLFTHPSGWFVKGEGPLDLKALSQCAQQMLAIEEGKS